MNNFTQKLNQIRNDTHQYDAYLTDDSTVVIAGPGSGKTTVLTLKIMRLLREQIHAPRGLACMTYNRSAAKEFNERLDKLGYQKRKNVFLGTVHSFCISQVIIPFAHLYDYDIPMPLKLASDKERKQVFNAIVSNLGETLSIEEMDKERSLQIYGRSMVQTRFDTITLKVAKMYEQNLHAAGIVDFIDIVKYSTLIIQNEKYVRDCLEAQFPWMLIDEYQDLGKPLHEMVLSLLSNTNIKIFAVGDPNQSIYSFNGAIPDYLIELFNLPDITRIKLLTNFRSNQDIINASEIALQSKIKENFKAGFRLHENAEFHFIVCDKGIEPQIEQVVNNIIPKCIEKGIPLHEICVMVGYNYQLKNLIDNFRQAGIPYHLTKHKDFDMSEVVKWLMKCSQWSIDKSKESFGNLFDFWLQLLTSKGLPLGGNDYIPIRKQLLSVLSDSASHSDNLSNWLNFIIHRLDLNRILTDSTLYPDEIENLEKLQSICSEGEFSEYSLEKFINLEKPENQVSLSTRHSSKGLEFETIILLGMEEENFPSYRTIDSGDPIKMEEEHRVFFVCVSRAKRICYLVRSNCYSNQYGRIFNKDPSRFWNLLETHFG
jgi:DNA helicase-2/ATP-dependent DNA helicase PcrA